MFKYKPSNSEAIFNYFRNNDFVVIAGPCSIENKEMIENTAKFIKSLGANFLRGGAFKPRSSPYSFQGLTFLGLELIKSASQITGLPVISEVMDPRDVGLCYEYIDIFQIGSRNMYNYPLLKEVGQSGKPVLIKRGLTATIDDFLNSATIVEHEGNAKIILCERGIRTFETYTRNTLDISIVPILKKMCNYPVIIDPSHATGLKDLILPMSLAALATGADGVMIEVHPTPSSALSDSEQSLDFDEFSKVINSIKMVKSTFPKSSIYGQSKT